MKAVPPSTSARRKAAAATRLDCVTAFQTIALDCVAAIEGHHSSACAGDVEAVHQIRIAITRLRAAVMLFAPIVVDGEWPRLKEEIAWLNGALGAARDSDVVLEYARRKEYRAWARCMIGERLEQQQVRNHRRLVRCLRSPRTQRLLAALARWIRQGPWLERCRVFVSPLRYGAGIKGKVLQALAHGVPVVATRVSLEGMGIVEGEDALVAETAEEFAAAIACLHEDEALWNRLSKAGPEAIARRFSTAQAKRGLEALYALAERRRAT